LNKSTQPSKQANSGEDDRKLKILKQIFTLVSERSSKRNAKFSKRFIPAFFRRVSLEDISREPVPVLASMIENLLDFVLKRKPEELLLRVYNPTEKKEGWESEHTVIEMVNDDMPFLVDSANLALTEMEIGVHLIIHPVMRLRRGPSGQLAEVCKKGANRGQVESVMQIQIDRQTDEAVLGRIQREIESSMKEVRAAVADWKKMRALAESTVEALPGWASRAEEEVLEESQDFLGWLVDDHFTFLGARDYEVAKVGSGHQLRIVKGSGLGILREDGSEVASRPLGSLAEAVRTRRHEEPLIVTKTNARSRIHRAGYMDYVGVLRYDEKGFTVGERRFLGLFTSNAYNRGMMQTPLVRDKVNAVLTQARLVHGSHSWKSMVHILETLPRDELFQASVEELLEIGNGVLYLQERLRVRLFIRRERFGRFFSCLVYIPRERFNTENREKIQQILKRALKGARLDYVVQVSESALARLHVIVRPKPGPHTEPNVQILEQKIVDALRSWMDELTEILVQKHGEETGLGWANKFRAAIPEAYKEDVSPWVAAFDIENAAQLSNGHDLRMSLYRPYKKRAGILRFKIFRREVPLPLSDVLPMLENLGLRIVSERPYEFTWADDDSLWIQDFDMVPVVGRDINVEAVRDRFQVAFERILRGQTESDGFNRLILAARLHWRQVKMIRAYCKFLLQARVTFSQSYMEETLSRHPLIARLLVDMFEAKFDPARGKESEFRIEQGRKRAQQAYETLNIGECAGDSVLVEMLEDVISARGGSRDTQVNRIRAAFLRALGSVSSLDEDLILHRFYNAIWETLRTNYFQPADDEGNLHEHISFKFDSSRLVELPQPRPFREIWVFSTRFEGIHLRCGTIARGGLRWSDRREDFRTEVLGLMKAQNVKNTMIVPVGAKGGFVIKKMPEGADRETFMKVGISCYSQFINGLLDITDNLDEESVLPPPEVVRHDGDDPYLVVAADKGTATFSDIANGIAQERGFWLGDAFASGGSVGYDHKGMGITAKGAWEGVKRHFRELGTDIQKQPFSVVGIGDMSGDVFGNGMLLSRQIRLQAAFNHQHIFLDPDPDPRAGFSERKRLFGLTRSSWEDYNREIISQGGGVFSRQAKTIPLSQPVRDWLGIEADQLSPPELIRELLKAPVDLLWNGGIGTYVKASSESHADTGDLVNSPLRVDGCDLRCKVVGEGGNLGFTQPGRIEFALGGGSINTDFIDNSAGVDCSDHEVNIKILLNSLMREGKLKQAARNNLLARMTDEVSELVLRSNYLQTQALSMMVRLTGARLGAKQHFIRVLEEKGLLDRDLENLPDDEEIGARRKRGEGLTRPELSVLLSYSKIHLYQRLLDSDIPEDEFLGRELIRYFPGPLQKKYEADMQGHRLRREIIATQVTNGLINRMGASFTLRMHEDTGASASDVAKAFTVAREIFDARKYWTAIEALDNKVDAALQTSAILAMWNLLRQATRWLLTQSRNIGDIEKMINRLGPGIRVLSKAMETSLAADDRAQLESDMQPYVDSGFPSSLALRIAMLPMLFPALDVVETAAQRRTSAERVSRIYFGLGDALELRWLRSEVEALKVEGQWHAHARGNLRNELLRHHNSLVGRVLKSSGRSKDPVSSWIEANEEAVGSVRDMLQDMRNLPSMDYATLAVAIRSLQQLIDGTA
jgi:glutamate dehydrogenase